MGEGTNESSRLIASHLNFHFLLAAMYARPSKCPFPSSSKKSRLFSSGGHDKDPSTCVVYAYSYGEYSGSVPLGRMILVFYADPRREKPWKRKRGGETIL